MPRGSAPSLTEQRKKLEAKLRAIKAKVAEESNRRFTVVGRAVLDHAEGDPAFRSQLREILAQQLTKKRDRELLGLDGAGEGVASIAPVAKKATPIVGKAAGGSVGGPTSSSS